MKTTPLGERLKEVMKELQIESPKDLATFCDVSEGLVSQWFSGTTKLGAKPLIAMSRTHFSLDWIVDGKQPKYRRDYKKPQPQHMQLAANQDDETPSPETYAKLIMLFGNASKIVRKEVLRSLDKAVKARPTDKSGVGGD
ncbi:helix-turn-helix transcriptional regulator [Herbaspirillum sp. ST 5-3]|uniref:helix-turn-helix domain-containing protein n=1 Tax=Oxalobacteraceae TaxID=75682 RepID=UPI0010A548BC|nr:helix-turn-helix transcriptional regulator [Herbaspirillum sp. ST 5-3]